MQIEVLGSSSLGNAYIVNDGTTSILLECGFSLVDMQMKSNFMISNVDACLLTHFHQDHSKGIKDLLKYAIDVYALPETLSALGVADHHRTHNVVPQKAFTINTFTRLLTISF